MAEINPPLYLDQDSAYGAAELGLPFRDIMGEGVVGSGDLLVTASTGLKSSVAAGAAWVKGDDNADTQPTYRVRNDAAVLLQHDAADATNPRIDLVIAQVKDSTFSGVSKLWQLAIVKGTPAASPSAPALPGDAIALAQVTIPAGSGTLGTITDKRTRAHVGSGAALVNSPPTAELAYADAQSDVSVTATAAASANTCVTLPAVSLDGATPVELEFQAPSSLIPGGGVLAIVLYDGSTQLGILWRSTDSTGGSTDERPIRCGARFTPTAGSHTYSIRAYGNASGGIVHGGGGTSGTWFPMWARLINAAA